MVEGDNEDIDNIVNDKAAALYGLFYAIGAIISPFIGSVIYNHDPSKPEGDWVFTCDVFGIASGVYAIIFLVFNILPDIHKEKELKKALLSKQLIGPDITVIDEDNSFTYAVNHGDN